MWRNVLTRKRKKLLRKQRQKKEKKNKQSSKKWVGPTQYKGVYKEINYQSCLELAVIIQCENIGLKIKPYDLEPISYFDPIKDKQRIYIPDFIIENFLICEVKWLGFVYKKKKEEIHSKRKALEYFCCANQNYTSLFITNKMVFKKSLEAARKYHKETYNETRTNGSNKKRRNK